MSQVQSKTGLTDLDKAAERISNDGLYGLILDDILADESEERIAVGRIREILSSSQKYLDEYRRLNKEHGVSNIDVTPIDTYSLNGAEKEIAEKFNDQLEKLKELENFSSVGSSLGYGMWVGSVTVLVIFALHNIFAMFTEGYRNYPALIYGLYAAVCVTGVFINAWFVKRHNNHHEKFKKIYADTVELYKKYFS